MIDDKYKEFREENRNKCQLELEKTHKRGMISFLIDLFLFSINLINVTNNIKDNSFGFMFYISLVASLLVLYFMIQSTDAKFRTFYYQGYNDSANYNLIFSKILYVDMTKEAESEVQTSSTDNQVQK